MPDSPARRWPHFSDAELACHCCGQALMDPTFMERLEALRVEFGRPMHLSSAYRCPSHDQAVRAADGKTTTGRHAQGRAVDVLIAGEAAVTLVWFARKHGFSGFGISQKGPHGRRFIHLDDDCGPDRPMIWSY